jgi:hypothetical protein
LQIIGPNIKFRFILAIIVKGIKHARNKSAHAKLTKYLLFVNLIGPRDPNITRSAAVFPSKASTKIINDILFITHSPSLIFEICDEFKEDTVAVENKCDEFRFVNERHDDINIFLNIYIITTDCL